MPQQHQEAHRQGGVCGVQGLAVILSAAPHGAAAGLAERLPQRRRGERAAQRRPQARSKCSPALTLRLMAGPS